MKSETRGVVGMLLVTILVFGFIIGVQSWRISELREWQVATRAEQIAITNKLTEDYVNLSNWQTEVIAANVITGADVEALHAKVDAMNTRLTRFIRFCER